MKYDNKEMKIDEMIGYFNQGKVNLIPPFQRGSVWNPKLRKKLLVNMIQVRPIPAIFFYKQAEGAQFVYNILDGKQRLESLILFIGNQRQGLKIRNVENYFFGKPAIEEVNFKIELEGVEKSFADLDNEIVRTFREYAIPTIEINMDDESMSIDELVSLFIDINQEGVKVTRFDVVKALGKDPLFKQVFDLIALKQTRKKKSRYYKAKNNNYVYVMKRLNIVGKLADRIFRSRPDVGKAHEDRFIFTVWQASGARGHIEGVHQGGGRSKSADEPSGNIKTAKRVRLSGYGVQEGPRICNQQICHRTTAVLYHGNLATLNQHDEQIHARRICQQAH